MAQNTELYHLLKSYAKSTGSPYIELDPFVAYIEKYAKRNMAERPEWTKWADHTGIKVWEELPALEKEEKCQILRESTGTRVFMPNYYIETIQDNYQNLDETADLPFPGDNTFKTDIPYNQIRPINVEFDLPAYLDDPQDTLLPILKLVFPEGLGNTYILANMIPDRLLEACFLKMRNYLRNRNNKEYIQHKLLPSFQGKESQVKDAINSIMVKPFEAVNQMESAGDFTFLFWSFFCNVIKKDIRQKNEMLPEDIAALQSISVTEVFNAHFKKKATRKKETELALKNLDLQLEKPPFLFSMGDIIKFRDSKSVPLLGQYSQEVLEEYILTKTTENQQGELPELLIIHNPEDERLFIKKKCMIQYCMRLLGDARPVIRKSISKRWLKIIKDYRSEPAMDNDIEFEKLLSRQMNELVPMLALLLGNDILYLTYVETKDVPEAQQIYRNGVLMPLSELLLIKRKALLTDTKILLPFWYSIPVLTDIIAFFKNWGKKRARQKQEEQEKIQAEENIEENSDKTSIQKTKLKKSADDFIRDNVPEGEDLNTYLIELQKRWNRLLQEKARKDLLEDVNSLIRDRVRRMLRVQQNSVLTGETITRMTNNIIADTPALQQFKGEALTLYIQLYIAKLVSNIRM